MKRTLTAGRVSTRPVLWVLLAGAAFAVVTVGAKVAQGREARELVALEQAAKADALADQARWDAIAARAADLKAHPEKYRASFRREYQPNEREIAAMAEFGGAKGEQTLAAAYSGALNVPSQPYTWGFAVGTAINTLSISALGGSVTVTGVGVVGGPPQEHEDGGMWYGVMAIYTIQAAAPGSSNSVTVWLWLYDVYDDGIVPGSQSYPPEGVDIITSIGDITWTIGLTGAYRRAKITEAIPAGQTYLRDVRQRTGTGHWFANADTVVTVAATVGSTNLSAQGNYGAASETDLTEGVLLSVTPAISLNYAPDKHTDYASVTVYAGTGTSYPLNFTPWTLYIVDGGDGEWAWMGDTTVEGFDPTPDAGDVLWYTHGDGNTISIRAGDAYTTGGKSFSAVTAFVAADLYLRLWKVNKEARTVSGAVERYTTYDTSAGHPFEIGRYKATGVTAANVSCAPDWTNPIQIRETWTFGVGGHLLPDDKWRFLANTGNGIKVYLRKDWMEANAEDVVFTDPATMKDLPRYDPDTETNYPLTDILQPLTFHPLDGDLDDPPWRDDWITWLRVERDLDQPAGATSRPSAFTGSGGVSVSGDTWTVPAGGGTVTRTLTTRRRNRIARMNAHLWTGSGDQQEVSHDWPLMTRANLAIETTGDDPKWWDPEAEPWSGEEVGVEFEDVTDWRMFSCVRLHATGATADQTVTLRLTYRTLSGTDQNYTGAKWNFGPGDGTFEATWSDQATASITATLNHTTGYAVFDLAPDAGASPLDLELVEKVEFIYAGSGTEDALTFTAWETVPYSGDGSSETRQRVAHKCSTDYWGTALWVDGMPDYKPTYLYPLDSERVEVGFENQQDQQPNPESEVTDDLRSLKLLSRFVNEVQYAESLIEPTWGTAAIEASLKDADDSWLGLPYCGDMDEDGYCLHVGTDLDCFFPIHTVYCDVILQGGARGIAKSGGVRHTSKGDGAVALYYTDDGGTNKTQVDTAGTDAQGMYRLWAGREKTPRQYWLLGTLSTALFSLVNAEEYWAGVTIREPKQPHLCEGYISDLYHVYHDALDGYIYYERKATAAMPWALPVSICEGSYPWADIPPTGELLLVYQTPASQTQWKRSRDLGLTWEDVGVAISGRYPMAAEYNGIQYCVTYTGTAQVIRRSQNYFSGLLTFGTATSAVVTSATNAERCAFLKQESAGRGLLCGVPSGNVVHFYRSKDDGETWTLES